MKFFVAYIHYSVVSLLKFGGGGGIESTLNRRSINAPLSLHYTAIMDSYDEGFSNR